MKTNATEILPLTETRTPTAQAELATVVADAYAAGVPLYPLGGGTSLEYGLPARQAGLGLSLAGLTRVIDYPARDMTITVEAGLRLADLVGVLAGERQWLPVEGPQPAEATIGGLVATAWSGPRRYGWGTMRDFVIGVSAVNGRGVAFKGGGRVVKNVAGYDSCKLLTGSCGTLAVITQLTLKLRPLPERSVLATCTVRNLDQAEQLLAGLVSTSTTPSAIELLIGPEWRGMIPPCPRWPRVSLVASWWVWKGLRPKSTGWFQPFARNGGIRAPRTCKSWATIHRAKFRRTKIHQAKTHRAIRKARPPNCGARLRDFSDGPADLALKASLPPGRVCAFMDRLLATHPDVNIQSHAGNGIVIARFPEFAAAEISQKLIGGLQPAAAASGHLTVLASGIGDLTRQCVWGSIGPALPWMKSVKEQFDPRGLFNPGRFVFA